MTATGVWAGAAGVALGLSLAGLYAAGVAAADAPAGPDRPAASGTDGAVASSNRAATSSGRAVHSGKAGNRPGRSATTASKPAAEARSAARSIRQPAPDNRASDLLNAAADAATCGYNPPSCPGGNATPPANAPSITIHNKSQETVWVYNLVNTADYSIPATPWMTETQPSQSWWPPPADWLGPVSIAPTESAPVTLAVFNAPPNSAGNRIYIVEGSEFTLPVASKGGIDPFYPPGSGTAPSFENSDSFQNYSFVEYSFYQDKYDNAPYAYPNTYTIDVSYIDEWSLPIQTKFTLNGSGWNGAVDGRTYGFKDFDTVVNQLKAAGGPWSDLVSSGNSPYGPQPPSSLSRIIGPDKVWTQQSLESPAANFNMNNTGWVPASYQNFVQYGFPPCNTGCDSTDYTYAYNGTGVSGTAQSNFDFWRYQDTTPGATPYPTALHTAAIHDGFPADANGAYGFFTYPNDETAGQFSLIPVTVSLDIYVYGSADGVSASVIPGGTWRYTSSVAQTETGPRVKHFRSWLSGTPGTDTFILNSSFGTPRYAPLIDLNGPGGDIAVIDKVTLGATSTTIDVVNRALFLGIGQSNSQFVYERSTGLLYFDLNPRLPGYTGVLGRFPGQIDPSTTLFVL